MATAKVIAPRRVLLLMDQKAIAELISLTLNHGVYVTRGAQNAAQALALVDEWQPDLAVIDMDIAGDRFLKRVSTSTPDAANRLPVLALTRRGDLKTKLAAFEAGVDDIMTVPFSPEELLARVLVLTRRAYGEPLKLSPVIKVGDLEIDILNRHVRAGSSSLHLTGVEQSPLPAGRQRRPAPKPQRDHGCAMGGGLCRREQRCGPAHPEPASEAARRLAKASIHRD